MEHLETFAKSLGMRYLWLTTMKKGKALKFYQQLGYSVKSEQMLPYENARPEEKEMYILAKEVFTVVP
jgi:ribosomal protein S18 acetylase RimI-like enzyme